MKEDLGSTAAAVPLPPVPGSYAKVWLPGETPWAECLMVNADGTWVGRIANHLFAQMSDAERVAAVAPTFGGDHAPLPSLHNYKQDQIVIWKLQREHDFSLWVPAESAGGST